MKQTKTIIEQHRNVTLAQLKQYSHSAVAEDLDVPEELNARFAERVAAINGDVGLNDRGKADAIKGVGLETLAELQNWEVPKMRALDANAKLHMDEIRAAVITAPSKDVGDKIEAALLRGEVRRAVVDLSPEEIAVLYRTCGDTNICRALEELPSITKTRDGAVVVKRLVSDELREEVLRDEGRRLLPVVAERLDDINEIRGVYTTVASSLRREVEKAVPVVFEPKIEVVV